LFELVMIVVPLVKVAVITVSDPPGGATVRVTASTLIASELDFVTLNCNAGTFTAPGIWVESGGVPVTVATVNAGGVAVPVSVAVAVLVVVKVEVEVAVFVAVFVAVAVGV
jgi:hypothetical protein